MRTGRPKQPITLDQADKEKLELLARRPKSAQRVAVRSKIILRAARGVANQDIASQLGVTGSTVGKWRERFRLRGMAGLADDSRPGTPRKITDAKVEEAVTRTLESLPPLADPTAFVRAFLAAKGLTGVDDLFDALTQVSDPANDAGQPIANDLVSPILGGSLNVAS